MMISTPVVCPKNPLPRELDVHVTISRPLTEIATDLTLICFLTPHIDLPPDNGRVKYYSSFAELSKDAEQGSSLYWAGKAFFDRTVRPTSMAVGKVFESPVAAAIVSGDVSIAQLQQITEGAFDLEVNGALISFSGLNFTSVKTLADAASIVAKAAPLGVEVIFNHGGVIISTSVTGEGATITYAEAPVNGTDVATLLGLTQKSGARIWQGYSPKGLVTEAELVRIASRCNQRPPYGWTIDAKYRDTAEQKELADWAELHTAYFSACTNSVTAYNPANTTNIGFYCNNKGYIRTSTIYHNNAQIYPDISYIALALATNYAETDAAITMKFKQLDGIEPSPLSESELSVLNTRRINSYVYIGNTSRTVREGVQGLDTWFTDTLVNLDNYREELQVEVYNVFLRNKKVPFSTGGQNMLVSAAAKTNRRYTRNGVFCERDVEAPELESGFKTLAATEIIPVPVAFATTSERAARIAPPIRVVAHESGAFHKVSINVSVFS